MATRCTRAESEQRTLQVLKMLANGVQRPAIIEFARTEWGLTRGSADLYIRKAKDEIKASINEERDEFLARKLFQLEDVLLKASKRENHSAMIGAIRLQCELAQVV